MYLYRVFFLTTLVIYKAYFRGHHIREYKENICKRWPMLYSLWKKLLYLYALGFCNQVLLDLHCWWSEEICSQQSSSSWCVSHVLGAVHHWLITYLDPCKKVGVHILKSSEILKWYKVSAVSSSTGIIEIRDKSFVLNLKFLFTIVDCFWGRFPPKFFTVKLVCFIGFIGFPRSSYFVLFTFPLCVILTWY